MVITRMLVVSYDDGCGFLEELYGDTLNSQLYSSNVIKFGQSPESLWF